MGYCAYHLLKVLCIMAWRTIVYERKQLPNLLSDIIAQQKKFVCFCDSVSPHCCYSFMSSPLENEHLCFSTSPDSKSLEICAVS